jgi:hypothetical protein
MRQEGQKPLLDFIKKTEPYKVTSRDKESKKKNS